MALVAGNILSNVNNIHFVGIGGSGMYPLAEILHGKGYLITGSDVNEGDNVDRLRSLGIPVAMGHKPENVADAELIVHTAAVKADNPELMAAAERGLPVLERSRLLGILAREYKDTIAVSGTHGKTTTTSMIAHVMLKSGADPTVIIGGWLPLIGGNGCAGKSDTLVCEACEYVDTFLQLAPSVSVILNIDADHLDYFGTLDNIITSFRKFAQQTTKTLIVNGDDPNSMKAVDGINREIITFGLKDDNLYRAVNLSAFDGAYYSFDLLYKNKFVTQIRLGVPGEHNVSNALAACAAALNAGIAPLDLAEHLESFRGAGRRFEIYGTFGGVTVADDYAHHPSEIVATLDAATKLLHKQVWAIFQPFTYSRTAMWLDEFAQALSLADHVILAPIMGSRETNKWGISSKDIAAKIPGSVYLENFDAIAEYVAQHARDDDFVITMGGGDIYKAARKIRDQLSKP